jgi:hypothetical protein
MAKAQKSSKTSRSSTPSTDVPSAKTTDSTQLHGELLQLAEIRQKFPALSPVLAGAFLALHGDDDCRARGAGTRAKEIFAGGLRWARTVGANAGDPALSPRRVRWFLDCLTALGDALAGIPVAINPSAQGSWDDAKHQAETLFARVYENVKRAAGSRSAWLATLDAVRATEGAGETVLARIEALAKAIEGWNTAADIAILDAFDVSAQTVTELRAAAATLNTRTRERGAPGQLSAGRDTPAANTAEGRVLFAMKVLWDDAATARAAGTSTLQYAVTGSLLRGLGVRRNKSPDAPTA